MTDTHRPHPFSTSTLSATKPSPAAVHKAFDPTRLTQARNLAGMTRKTLAGLIGVTAAAVCQYELGTTRPRPEVLPQLAEVLTVPMTFFLAGRPHGRLDASMAHFRSPRSTRAYQRTKAIAFIEQAWELTHALEKRVQLPWMDLPGFAGGEVSPGTELPSDPIAAARALRVQWKLGTGPVTHLIRRMEAHGIIVLTPQHDPDWETVDAFSTSRLPRPIVILTPNPTDDVYRHRFSAAHELGHLVLHSDTIPGDTTQEHQADVFAAEFLTPRDSILPNLPAHADLHHLSKLRRTWGVPVDSLLHRCRELGLLSDSSATRAHQRLHTLHNQPGFTPDPLTGYPGEQPALLTQAFSLACDHGLTISELAHELAWNVPRVRELLNITHHRPALTLINGGADHP
jgi:Zn-dependent peptidase ImmA (M78 family)/transcriptional regulator with XRE-family HTH domain